jgi:hypothetical protein
MAKVARKHLIIYDILYYMFVCNPVYPMNIRLIINPFTN